MLSVFRQLTAGSSVVLTRTFASSCVMSSKAATTYEAKVKKMQASLNKEKAQLEKLRDQHKALSEKQKALVAQRKAEVAEKKLEEKALKPYRKMTALNAYIKENTGNGTTLAEVGKLWNTLTDSQKAEFQSKADAANAANLKIWKPAPSAPPNRYALFVKQNWIYDERTFREVSKHLASVWKTLPESEKEAFAPTKQDLEAFKRTYQAWKDERIKLWKEKVAAGAK